MQLDSKLNVQRATFDGSDAGEGLAIFFTQNGDSVCRWRFLVQAMIGEGVYDVGEFYSSPPLATARPGRLSRMVAGAVCPGATSWAVEVSAVPIATEIAPETAEIILSSSRCYAQVGVQRVGERYAYHAGTGTQNFTVLAGMKVTGIAAVGLGGGGTLQVAGGDIITIPAGISINLEPAVSISPNSVIAFVGVDWAIEYLESA